MRGTACLGLRKWVSVRLSVCLSRGLSQESVFASLVRSVSGAGCPSWGGEGWGPFVPRCLEPGLALVGLAQRWIPSMCVIV